jgi:hypothetical protein
LLDAVIEHVAFIASPESFEWQTKRDAFLATCDKEVKP